MAFGFPTLPKSEAQIAREKEVAGSSGNPKKWIGGIIVLVLLVAGIAYLSTTPYLIPILPAILNFYVLIGVVVGLAIGAVSSNFKMKESITAAIAVGLVVALVIFFMPSISNAYQSISKSTSSTTNLITNSLNPTAVQQQYATIWSTPTAPEPSKISPPQFVLRSKSPLSVVAGFTLKTDTDLTLIPQCSLDGNIITTDPAEKTILKSDTDQHFSVTCTNNVAGKELDVKISNPASVEAVAEVWLGSPPGTKGKVTSNQDHDSAYSLSLSTEDDQPFNSTGSYPLTVKIQRTRATATLQSINSLKISTISNNFHVDCPFTDEISTSALAQYANKNNKANDEYDISCQLVVTNIPDSLERSFLVGDISYVSQEDFKTTLS